jgi:hypothetical protein
VLGGLGHQKITGESGSHKKREKIKGVHRIKNEKLSNS